MKPITSHPRVAAWLAPEGLIRNFVVVVSIVGEGRTPAGQLRVLRPSAGFRVVERGGDPYIDPNSYEGYDGLTDSAASIDPAGAARLYATLNPRIEEAYRDLGVPAPTFDRALERAIVLLARRRPLRISCEATRRKGLATASPLQTSRRCQPHRNSSCGWDFEMSGRFSRHSVRFALALGIPAERLPAPKAYCEAH